jgi:hypothetical protein
VPFGLPCHHPSTLSQPVNAIVNGLVLPIINREIGSVPLPTLDVSFSGYRLVVNFTHPELATFDGFVLVGTDAQASLTPP